MSSLDATPPDAQRAPVGKRPPAAPRWPEHLGGEASFAALRGVSPVERSSGSRQYRRLNRGSDRQANAALHRIVTRSPAGMLRRGFYARRTRTAQCQVCTIAPCGR
ncbi:transposase [Streptomyces lydicus]|uniref:transposase n=1 Tax=Streptomyces lydicus TaxID=47763 RepID=UPI00367BD426